MAGLNVAEGRVDDDLINLDFNRICRLCLKFCRDYVDLRPSNGNRSAPRHIIDQIKYCYCIKIDLTEPLPSKVCLQCVQILTLLCATKRNIKYSELMLRNILTLRNARHANNTQNSQAANLLILQRLLTDDDQGEQERPVLQDRPTHDNGQVQNLSMRPMQITTMWELYQNQDSNDENLPTQTKMSQSAEKHTERRDVEHSSKNINDSDIGKENENKENVENKPVKTKLNESSDSNSNSGESSSSGSDCSTITDSKLPEKNVCDTVKTAEEDKSRSTNKKPSVVQNTNKRKFEIDMKRDLRVKLEVLDLKNIKFCSVNTSGLCGSTEGRGGRPSVESSSGKAVKEIGTDIDESNILSPKAKRMRKSNPKR